MSDENELPAEPPAPTHAEFNVSADEVTILIRQLGSIAGAYYEEGKLFVPIEIAAEISAAIDGLPAIVLAAVKIAKVASLDAACAAAIVSGYRSSALGSDHLYPSNIKDQINMMGSVTDSLLPGSPEDFITPFWCANDAGEWEYRPHSAEQIQQAGTDGKKHVQDCQLTLANLTAMVRAAATIAEVEAIDWEAA